MHPPEWIPAKFLTTDHMIGFKIELIETNPRIVIKQTEHQKRVKYISDDRKWYILGYFLGNGRIDNGKIYFKIDHDRNFTIISSGRQRPELVVVRENITY